MTKLTRKQSRMSCLSKSLLVDIEEQVGGDVNDKAEQEAKQDGDNHQPSLPKSL